MKRVLYIDAAREGYGIDQIRNTMTVGELIRELEQYDENDRVFLRHDRGYTYGGITSRSFEEPEDEQEDEDEPEEE